MEQFFDYIVKESKNISENERKLWKKMKQVHKDTVDEFVDFTSELLELEEENNKKI
jgi:hypothetical protein